MATYQTDQEVRGRGGRNLLSKARRVTCHTWRTDRANVVTCALDAQTVEAMPHRFTPDNAEILAWIIPLPSVRVLYLADMTGFGLAPTVQLIISHIQATPAVSGQRRIHLYSDSPSIRGLVMVSASSRTSFPAATSPTASNAFASSLSAACNVTE